MRFSLSLAVMAATLLVVPVHAAIDGKVTGLNKDSHEALAAIKRRNPGSLTVRDAEELKLAIMKDGKVDDAERDLLEEMTQSQFRKITVTLANAKPADPSVSTYPMAGNAKKVLQDVLNPPADLEKEWSSGVAGWNVIVREYKKPAMEMRVLGFATGKFADEWAKSNMANGYKPLRDEIGKRYGYANAATVAEDINKGRNLIYKAMETVDKNVQDAVPDFLYNWTRPGGFL